MSEREPFITERLYCPGPTPVPLAAKLAGMDSSVYHRTEDFYKIFRACRELLQPLFGSENAPLILTCSGTGAMEAALVNLTAEGDEVVVVNGGKFGERFEKLATTYACKVLSVKVEWGHVPRVEDVTAALAKCRAPKAFFMQANETSTGVYYPVEVITAAVRKAAPDCLIVVDAVSGLGAHPMRMHSWDIDCVVAGSQKGFGIPPGLAFVALSQRAWEHTSTRPRFYFDLAREQKNQETGATAWTPATTLVASLLEALKAMHAIGYDAVLADHARRADAVRAAAKAMNLTLFPAGHYSNAVTAMALPPSLDGKKLLSTIKKKYGAIFAGGQDQLTGKIVRYGHLGFLDRFDVLSGIAALEFGLHEVRHSFSLGDGTKAAMSSFVANPSLLG